MSHSISISSFKYFEQNFIITQDEFNDVRNGEELFLEVKKCELRLRVFLVFRNKLLIHYNMVPPELTYPRKIFPNICKLAFEQNNLLKTLYIQMISELSHQKLSAKLNQSLEETKQAIQRIDKKNIFVLISHWLKKFKINSEQAVPDSDTKPSIPDIYETIQQFYPLIQFIELPGLINDLYRNLVHDRFIRASTLSLKDCGIHTLSELIHYLREFGPQLTTLNLSVFDYEKVLNHEEDGISDQVLEELLDKTPNLKSLNISKCNLLNDSSVETIAQRFPGLTELRLKNCNQITNKGITSICTFLPNIESLDLSYNPNVGITKLEQLKTLTKLTELRLKGTELNDSVLEKIIPVLTNLRVLDIRRTKASEEMKQKYAVK